MATPATPSSTPELLAFTAQIVAAHVTGHKIAADALPDLIRSVHDALARAATVASEGKAQEPAVSIKRSIHPNYLICLEDGAKVKALTRYLRRFGLTPDTYRAKWGLPRDYPMVAPASTVGRSLPAKPSGLVTASPTTEPPAPEHASDKLEAMAPSAPVELEAQHTAASVFANFPAGDVPEQPSLAANDADKPGRRRFAQQFMREGRKRA